MNNYNPNWQTEYEKEIYEKYICAVSKTPCINCSKYGCDHRILKDDYNQFKER